MSNLLEKASILTTPTAYDNGKILSVKPAKPYSDEITVNGNFATDSDWTKDAGWTISNGEAIHTGSGSYISQTGTTIGKNYKVVIEVTQASGSGFPQIYMGGLTTAMTSVGTYTFDITATSTLIRLRGINDCKVTSISVKEVLHADFDFTRNSSATRVNAQGLVEDVQILSSNLVSNGDFSQEGSELVTNGSFDSDSGWTLGTGWSIANGNANSDGVSSNSNLVTTSAFYSGSTPVKMTINVTDYVSGGLKVYLSSTNFTEITANGNYTFYTTADRTDGKLYLKSINFIGSIDNVSVKEVGQDWTLGIGWSIGANKVIGDGTMGGNDVVRQLINFSQGTTYRFSFTVLDYVSGGVFIRNPFNGFLDIASANGSYSFDYVAGINDYIDFRGNSFVGSITNISVLEITDDTNLPRINYEGFSYQDALGSELVTNGTFDTDSNWNKGANWSILNGVATSNGSGLIQQSTSDLTPGKTYKISFEITEYTSGGVKLYSGSGSDASTYKNTVGTHTDTLVLNGSTTSLYSNNFIGSIDNVSVKEYLGQEVVPDSGVGSWLFEPQSTNLVTYSEDFSQWDKSNAITVTSNATTSPSGELNASLLSTTTTDRFIYLSVNSAANSTFSIYVKWKNGSGGIDLSVDGGFNYTSVSVTSEWTRVSITPSSSITQLVLRIPTASELYVWGAQAEAQSFATSYIPTNGSTVTRLQDAAFGAGSSDLINSTEGVLYAEIAALNDDLTNKQISLNNGTTDDRIQLYYSSSSNQISVFYKSQSGATAFILNHTLSDITQFNKVAFKWKQNDFALWSNGVEVATQTSGVTSIANTLTKLDFTQFNGSADFFGKTKCLAVFKEALTNEELTCLTTI